MHPDRERTIFIILIVCLLLVGCGTIAIEGMSDMTKRSKEIVESK